MTGPITLGVNIDHVATQRLERSIRDIKRLMMDARAQGS